MCNKTGLILQILLYISIGALAALAFASIASIFTGGEYNWEIASKSYLAILIAGIACRLIERSLDGRSGND